MRDNEYRLNVRFDLNDEKQRRIVDSLKNVDKKKYGSINAFVIAALGDYIEKINTGDHEHLLQDIRALLREELSNVSVSKAADVAPAPVSLELSEEQKEENKATVLSAISLFG